VTPKKPTRARAPFLIPSRGQLIAALMMTTASQAAQAAPPDASCEPGADGGEAIDVRDASHVDVPPIEHPPVPVAGAMPPPDERGGCCGTTQGAYTAGLDLRAIAGTAFAMVLAAGRRRRKPEKKP
jgi:hypothetical protein